MMQSAVWRKYAGESKVRIASNKVADFSPEAQQRKPGLEVESAAVLQCGFVLRQTCGVQRIVRPAAANAHPRRNRRNRGKFEPQPWGNENRSKMIDNCRRSGNRERL